MGCGRPLRARSGAPEEQRRAAVAAAGNSLLSAAKPAPAISALTPVPDSQLSSDPSATVSSAATFGSQRASAGHLEVVDFGPRYKVEKLLGEGGMGAVYKAQDLHLKRTVALKLIRVGLSDNPMIVERFKQELLLASKVSHKNVLRIHDLGEHGGQQFISMAYVEGEDLNGLLLREGRLPLKRALSIARQLCTALEAAHAEGVVHRDLKPQNILLDSTDHVYVSDFGLAKSLEDDVTGMTRSGETLGTPRYMAPEQVQSSAVDHRADLYALGVILYEMLTGDAPFRAKSAIQVMYKTVHEQPKNPQSINPEIPDWLAALILKCLEKESANRYESASAVLADLEAAIGPTSRVSAVAPAREPAAAAQPRSRRRLLLIAAGLTVLIAAAAGLWFGVLAHRTNTAAEPAISMAILPFRNASGDPKADWLSNSLAEMLATDVGQSASLRVVSPDRLHQILRDLRVSADSSLDPPTLKRLAEFSAADRVIVGQYTVLGGHIRIDATLRDLVHDRSITLKAEANDEKDLVNAVNQLTRSVQQNLTLSSRAIHELQSTSFTPTSKSVEALRAYSEGLELNRQGNNLEALKRFQAAVQSDPTFALAYSQLGLTYSALGYDKEAELNSSKGVELAANLPAREKYQIMASNARILNDFDKGVDAYQALLKLVPGDPQTEFALALLYENKGGLEKARGHLEGVLQRDPKNVDALLEMGRVLLRSNLPQPSLDYLNRGLSLAVEINNDQAKANILQGLGVAYKKLGRLDDALRNYQESLAIKRRIGDKRGMGVSLDEIAMVEQMSGKPDAAYGHFQDALKVQREIADKKGVALSLMDLGNLGLERGQYEQALKYTSEALQMYQDLGNEQYQAQCLDNMGSAYQYRGEYENALTYHQRALEIRQRINLPKQTAETLQNLAETYSSLAQYDQALGHYLRALDLARNAGDARLTAFISGNLGRLFEYQGRYGAALSAKQDAVKALEQGNDQTRWMAEVQAGYGHALSLVMRAQESGRQLDEALRRARELNDDPLVAEVLNYKGDLAFYGGDYKGARSYYEQALATSAKTAVKSAVVTAKVNLAKVAVEQRRFAEAVPALKKLALEAQTLRLKYLGIVISTYLGEAYIGAHDYQHAREELEGALRQSENLGLRSLRARALYLLGTLSRDAGNAGDASQRFQHAAQIVQEMQQESKSDALLQRADLKNIAAAIPAASAQAK